MIKISELFEEKQKILKEGYQNNEDIGRSVYMDIEIIEKCNNSVKSDSEIGGKFLRNEEV